MTFCGKLDLWGLICYIKRCSTVLKGRENAVFLSVLSGSTEYTVEKRRLGKGFKEVLTWNSM